MELAAELARLRPELSYRLVKEASGSYTQLASGLPEEDCLIEAANYVPADDVLIVQRSLADLAATMIIPVGGRVYCEADLGIFAGPADAAYVSAGADTSARLERARLLIAETQKRPSPGPL